MDGKSKMQIGKGKFWQEKNRSGEIHSAGSEIFFNVECVFKRFISNHDGILSIDQESIRSAKCEDGKAFRCVERSNRSFQGISFLLIPISCQEDKFFRLTSLPNIQI
jgi:hypothetical protein